MKQLEIPEFSYWFNKRSKVVYHVYNCSDDDWGGYYRDRVSLTSCNGNSARRDWIITSDQLIRYYELIGEGIEEELATKLHDRNKYRRYKYCKTIYGNMKGLEDRHPDTFDSQQYLDCVNEYEEMIYSRRSK
jgi:hypothetical protein